MARTFVAASSQFLERTASVPLTGPPLTIAAWFKPTALATCELVSLENSAAFQSFELQPQAGGGIIAQAFDGSNQGYAVSSGAYTASSWNHAVAVCANATTRIAYLNGGNKVTNTQAATVNVTGIDRLSVGRRYTGGSPGIYANGDIAEVAIWNVALTDADVAALALGVSPLFVRPDALVFYAPLMGASSPEIDLFGRRDLTITGATAASHVRVFRKTTSRRAAFSKVAATFAADGTLTFSPTASFALHAGLAANGTLSFAAAANLAVGAARFAANPSLLFTVLSDLAAGVRPTTILAWLAGRQAHIRDGSLSILDALNAVPNTASATVDTTAPVTGQPLVIGVGTLGDPARTIFAGEVQTVDQTYVGTPLSPLWPITCVDYTFQLNRRRPFGTWVNVSATTIAQAVIAAYAPGFTAVHVQTALPAVSIIADGSQDFGTFMQALATAVGGYYGGPDYTKDIWLFLTDATSLPDPLDVSHPFLNDPPITVSTDLSQVRTRVYGKGHGEAVPTDVLANETIVPVADAVMFNPAGGQALAGTTSAGAQSQRLAYTGTQLGGGGSLAGPGAAPSTAPGLALAAGAGLSTGVYQYAYTDVTPSGESLPSPLGAIATTASLTPPTAPTLLQTFPGSVLAGTYNYAVTFVTASGETLPSAILTQTITGSVAAIQLSLPIGPAGVIARKLYRTVPSGSQLKLTATIANNTSPAYNDATPDGSLGANAPVVDSTGGNQVAVSGIAVGSGATTSRKLYRTAVNGAQLKLLATLANNTATTYADAIADGALGANAPTSDTSGLTQPAGQVNAGSATLLTASAGPFASGGGWAILGGGQVVRYTGITGNTLTGIPATGPGAILTTVLYGSQVLPCPALTGVTGLTLAMLSGSPVSIWVQRDDLAAQAALSALEGGDGIHEFLLIDERRGEASLAALCDANLALYARPLMTVTYQTRDLKTKSGKSVHIDLPATAAYPAILGDFTIQQATITIDGPALLPRFAVSASSVRFSLDDLLRRALLVAA